MKFATQKDVNYYIQILKLARDKQSGTYAELKICPSINRVILELEEIAKYE